MNPTYFDRLPDVPQKPGQRKATKTGAFRFPRHSDRPELQTHDGLELRNDCVVQSVVLSTGLDYETVARKLMAARTWHPYMYGNLESSFNVVGYDLVPVPFKGMADGTNVLSTGHYVVRGRARGRRVGHAWVCIDGEHWNGIQPHRLDPRSVRVYRVEKI